MKSQRYLSVCAFVLSFVPSLASAGEPSLASWVEKTVGDGVLKPLAKQESAGRRFSRARPAPSERRVRALQPTASLDKRERSFVPFAVDVRFGSEWHEADFVGCVYRTTGQIFVKVGDGYRPSAFLFGKNVDPVAGVCEAAPPPARS